MGKIASSVIRAIETAWLECDPCPNIYMERIFDTETYRELVERLPPADLYTDIDHPDAKGRDGRATRRLLDLAPHTLERMNGPTAAVWRDAYEELICASVTHALFDKLGVARRAVVPVPILYKDQAGYRIKEHTDAPYKIATLQLYLPADSSMAALGTEFYRLTDEGFRLVKRNDFLPASGYAFMRTDSSWHSVSELPRLDRPRDSLAITYYVPGYAYSSKPGYVAPEIRGHA